MAISWPSYKAGSWKVWVEIISLVETYGTARIITFKFTRAPSPWENFTFQLCVGWLQLLLLCQLTCLVKSWNIKGTDENNAFGERQQIRIVGKAQTNNIFFVYSDQYQFILWALTFISLLHINQRVVTFWKYGIEIVVQYQYMLSFNSCICNFIDM